MIWTSPSPTFNFVFWNERAEEIFAYCNSHILFCKLLGVSLIDYEFWLKWQCSKSNIAYKRKNTKNAFSSVLQSKRKNKLLLSLLRNFVQTSHFMGSSHCNMKRHWGHLIWIWVMFTDSLWSILWTQSIVFSF